MAICEGLLERGRAQDFPTFSRDERVKGSENLPLGRASIASGYTPDAGVGVSPVGSVGSHMSATGARSPRLSPRPPKGGV